MSLVVWHGLGVKPMTALKLEALVSLATAYDGSEAGGSGTV